MDFIYHTQKTLLIITHHENNIFPTDYHLFGNRSARQ